MISMIFLPCTGLVMNYLLCNCNFELKFSQSAESPPGLFYTHYATDLFSYCTGLAINKILLRRLFSRRNGVLKI
jgi:hypothetical protein